MHDREPATVGELLGIRPAAVAGICLYDVGSEPAASRPTSRSGLRARRVPRGVLNAFLGDADAGASDADIAQLAGCTVAQVRRARLARGIRRPAGRPSTHSRVTALAIAVFGRPFEPVVTRVKSVVDGRAEPPRYLVRESLDYAAFIRCVGALLDAGFSADHLSRGLGVRKVDIERAEKIARRR